LPGPKALGTGRFGFPGRSLRSDCSTGGTGCAPGSLHRGFAQHVAQVPPVL